MEKILVSACLMGHACRYDGEARPARPSLPKEAVLLPFCPEQEGGLPTPRPPAEICGGEGEDVIAGRIEVKTQSGRNVTEEYLAGAYKALAQCHRYGIKRALLKTRSPSCGVSAIYDGTFTGTLRPGAGVTAALLRLHGIEVQEID